MHGKMAQTKTTTEHTHETELSTVKSEDFEKLGIPTLNVEELQCIDVYFFVLPPFFLTRFCYVVKVGTELTV